MLLTILMLVAATVIFTAVFIALACIQFWTIDSAEVANAFTYGGNTVTSYPLTIFPSEVLKAMTFVLPLAFVNWYPSLHVLGREDPLGYPDWTQWLSPLVAALHGGRAAAGVAHRRARTTDRRGADRCH